MTSLSRKSIGISLKFLGDAASVYGDNGLAQATEASAGVDLRACLPVEQPATIAPGERRMIPAGIAIELMQTGVAGFVYSRSGLGGVTGITVAQGVGVIDPDYRGEIRVPILNTGQEAYTVQRGDRIAQLIFQAYFRPVFTVTEELGSTERARGGFGHTGRK